WWWWTTTLPSRSPRSSRPMSGRRGCASEARAVGGETIWVELLRVLAALVVVVPTAYVVTRFLGGRARPRRGRYMTLVESLPLGAQRGLHLVQVGERFFLV